MSDGTLGHFLDHLFERHATELVDEALHQGWRGRLTEHFETEVYLVTIDFERRVVCIEHDFIREDAAEVALDVFVSAFLERRRPSSSTPPIITPAP